MFWFGRKKRISFRKSKQDIDGEIQVKKTTSRELKCRYHSLLLFLTLFLSKRGKWVVYYMMLAPNLFILSSPTFVNKNTQLMSVSVKTVRMAKYGPGKNQTGRSDLPLEYLAIQWIQLLVMPFLLTHQDDELITVSLPFSCRTISCILSCIHMREIFIWHYSSDIKDALRKKMIRNCSSFAHK